MIGIARESNVRRAPGDAAIEKDRIAAWLLAVVILAVVLGAYLRFDNLAGKTFWEDEAFTALHTTGHLDHGDLRPLFNGRIYSVSRLQELETLSDRRGLGATVSSLAAEDRDQGVLYYILERGAVTLFGTSIMGYRLLGALLGVLSIGAAWLLADILYNSKSTAALFAGIVALSPFEVLYAHEARGYTLTALMTLLGSYLFLRGVRRPTFGSWTAYSVAMTLGLYSSLLLALVAIGHVVYAGIVLRDNRRALLGCVTALCVSAALYAPWFIGVAFNNKLIGAQLAWGATKYPLRLMVEKWLFNANAQFFDLEWLTLKFALIGALVLALMAAATIVLVMRAPRKQWTFVLLLGGITAALFIGRDLVTHSHWSTIARYLIPTWLAFQLAVAYALDRWRTAAKWGFVLVVLVFGVEGVSAVVNTQAASWYNNQIGAPVPSLAKVINKSVNPLVVGEKGWAFYLDLSRYLRPGVHVELFADAKNVKIDTAGYDVIVPTPSQAIRQDFSRQGYALQKVYAFRGASTPYRSFHKALKTPKAAKTEHSVAFPDRLYALVRKT